MLCMAGASVLNSCSDDDSTSSGNPDMPESGNALICNGVVREIKSAVYSVETPGNGEKADASEAASVYTIYLSPTAGLVDVDGMLIADDAVKITVKQPSGAVDLAAAGNGIAYGEIDVNSSNVGEASKADLSVEFLSARVARISAEIETGGKTLTVAYYGLCKNSDASEEGDDADKVLLDKVPLSWYLGPVKGVESHNYYMAFTDAEHTVSKGRVTLKEAGYLFVADLYAVPGEDAYTLPEGEYMASQLNEDHTFTSQYTGVQYIDAEGNKTQLSLVSGEPLKVSHEGDVWSVSLRFVDTDGSEKSIVYEGQLQIVDQPEDGGFYLPQIGRDVEVVGFSATATYYGNMLEAGTGMMQINIYDETYDTEEGQGGLAAALVVFNDLVRQSEGSRDQAPRISGQHLVPMGVVDARRGNSDGGAGIPARHLCPVGRRNLFRTIFLRKGGHHQDRGRRYGPRRRRQNRTGIQDRVQPYLEGRLYPQGLVHRSHSDHRRIRRQVR